MRRLFLSFLFAVIATVATAAPVRFMPVTLVQPQGDTVYCYVSGDEFFHRLHDADGYTIIRHPVTGQYVYASLAEGDLVPTSFVVGSDDPKTSGLEPNLIPDAKHLKRLHDVLAGTPYEHIIILVNTDHYGGGGIYNSYNLTYAHGDKFRPVVVHEFGHSFGGLGDEYPYGDDDPTYFADTEPWEPNLTTQHDFNGKWENLVKEGKAGLIEGGGYLKKGVWRGFENCRMRTNEEPEFCLVCRQALTQLIDFYTK